MSTRVSVVVLAWGDEPLLRECVASAIDSVGVDVDVVLVDNGATAAHVTEAAALPRVEVVRPPANLGFAGGCNLGASQASGDILAFLNSDARLDPTALRQLVDALTGDTILVTASVRLWDQPGVINTVGNPWHYLGFVWAGGLNQPADRYTVDADVMCASGATMALKASDWRALGGFDDEYFAYHEDAELSLRIWQRGGRVRYIAGAISYHHYEFSRNPHKNYLLERNRLMTLLTHYEGRTLVAVLPMLTVAELGIALLAIKQGWISQKLSCYRSLLHNRRHIQQRRREVQAARSVSDRELAPMFESSLTAEAVDVPAAGMVNALLSAYWSLARRTLTRSPRRASCNPAASH